MAPGFAPVLAQILTIAVGDRAELRAVTEQADIRYEAEDSASISTTLDGRNSSLRLEYSPTLIVTPLGSPSRSFNLFHHAGAGASITHRSRRTTFTASQSATFDQASTRIEALSSTAVPAPGDQGPDPGAPEPPMGDPGGPMAMPEPLSPDAERIVSSDITSSGSLRTEFSAMNRLSRTSTLSGALGYALWSGLGDSRKLYPLVQGPDAGIEYANRVSRRDELSTLVSSRYAFSANGDRVFIAGVAETWEHRFSPTMSLGLGVGASYFYIDPHDSAATGAFIWGAGSGAGLRYNYVTRFAQGRLTIGVGANYAPAVDQSSFEVDARISALAGVSWNRRRLTLFAGGSGVLSAEPDDPGALNTVGVGLGGIYDLGAGFSFEAGARGAWQTFEKTEIVAPSGALYAALSWQTIALRAH